MDKIKEAVKKHMGGSKKETMTKDKLRETIKSYIQERTAKLSEDESDTNADLVAGDTTPIGVKAAVESLNAITDEKFIQALRGLTQVQEVGVFLLYMIDFINKNTPAPNLSKELAHQYIDRALASDFDPKTAREKYKDREEKENPEVEEEPVAEISTTAASPAPATKYAYKLKKK